MKPNVCKREREGVEMAKRQRIETRSISRARQATAVEAALWEPPVVKGICSWLPCLPDILCFARCSKRLYELVNRCYPELAVLRALPYTLAPGRQQWLYPNNGASRFHEVVTIPALHAVVFRYACECLFVPRMDKVLQLTTHLDNTLRSCVSLLCFHQLWSLLDEFLVLVKSWERTSYDRQLVVDDQCVRTQMPEILAAWTVVAEKALLADNVELLRRALAPIKAYYCDWHSFDLDWHMRANPYNRNPTIHLVAHARFADWCINTLVPRLHSYNIPVQRCSHFDATDKLIANIVSEQKT